MASRSAVVRSTHPSGSCVRLALCLVLSSELVAVFRFVQNGPCASVTILLGAASTHNGLGRSRDDSWERRRSILRFDSAPHSHQGSIIPAKASCIAYYTYYILLRIIFRIILASCELKPWQFLLGFRRFGQRSAKFPPITVSRHGGSVADDTDAACCRKHDAGCVTFHNRRRLGG